MKKLLAIAMAALMLVSCMTFVASAEEVAPVTVTLNGNVVDCAAYGQPATIVEGRTLVPLRAIFEALGATVEWDQPTKTVTSQMGDITIALTIGADSFTKNGEEVALDVPGMIMNGRTLVPARAIAEAYGVDVQWDAATRTVILTKVEEEEEPEVEVPADGVIKYSEPWSSGNDGFQVTEDGYFMASNAFDKQSWNYIWFPGNFKPGERYIVQFDVKIVSDAFGNEDLVNPNIGVCFSYGENGVNDGKVSHHGATIDGKHSTVQLETGVWKHVVYIYEMPQTLNMDSKFDFGVYTNPIDVAGYSHKVACNFYVNNLTVELYTGTAENGLTTLEAVDASETASSITVDTAEGIAFEFDDIGNFVPSIPYEIVDGMLVCDSTGDNDPRITDATVSFNADDYKAVVVKVKYSDFIPADPNHPERFGIYFGTEADPTLSQSKYSDARYSKFTPDEDGWYTLYIDMTSNENWKGMVNQIRMDAINGEGKFTIDKMVIVEK